jgi:uncharacterized protein YjbI with pentapeptide repeats
MSRSGGSATRWQCYKLDICMFDQLSIQSIFDTPQTLKNELIVDSILISRFQLSEIPRNFCLVDISERSINCDLLNSTPCTYICMYCFFPILLQFEASKMYFNCALDWNSFHKCKVRHCSGKLEQSKIYVGLVSEQSSLEQSSLEQSSLEQSSLEQSSLEQSSLEQSSLEQSSLEQSSLEHSSLEHSSLEHSSLEHNSLEHRSFEYTSLEQSSLEPPRPPHL